MTSPFIFLAFFRFLDHLLDVMDNSNFLSSLAQVATLGGVIWTAVMIYVDKRRVFRLTLAALDREEKKALAAEEKEKMEILHRQRIEAMQAELAIKAQEAALRAKEAADLAERNREAITSKLTESIKAREEQVTEIKAAIADNKAAIVENTAITQEVKMEAKAAYHEANNVNLKIANLGMQMNAAAATPQPVEVTNWPDGVVLEPSPDATEVDPKESSNPPKQ